MISIIFCLLALVITFYAGRRSLVSGLIVVLGVGYFYGIIRANIPETGSHFTFDAAVAGLYLARWRTLLLPPRSSRGRALRLWTFFLIAWPAFLFLIPVQDILVELTGLRAHIFLLPFLIVGSQLSEEDLYHLALCVSVLNLIAFGFAVAEYFIGVDHFFPYREDVTTIIYQSTDVAGYSAYRIPATFTSAHAYAGAMVGTIPLLVGAWVQPQRHVRHRLLFVIAMIASSIGAFMAAARTPVVMLFILLVIITFSKQVKTVARLGWIPILFALAWLVSSEERLQRFMTLQNTNRVSQRVYGSLNERFTDLAVRYPLGNGLGGGGTSLPYFLLVRVKDRPYMENEYVKIALELGLPGLCLWVAFLVWAFFRRANPCPSSWQLGRRLAWWVAMLSFSTGLIGTGLLTSIPGTILLLMFIGWITTQPKASVENRMSAPPVFQQERQVWSLQNV